MSVHHPGTSAFFQDRPRRLAFDARIAASGFSNEHRAELIADRIRRPVCVDQSASVTSAQHPLAGSAGSSSDYPPRRAPAPGAARRSLEELTPPVHNGEESTPQWGCLVLYRQVPRPF